jgi:allophanate hydrolase subunit 2
LNVLANFPHYSLTSVALPTGRAGESSIGIRFSGAFERYAAACAEDLYGLSHGDSPQVM